MDRHRHGGLAVIMNTAQSRVSRSPPIGVSENALKRNAHCDRRPIASPAPDIAAIENDDASHFDLQTSLVRYASALEEKLERHGDRELAFYRDLLKAQPDYYHREINNFIAKALEAIEAKQSGKATLYIRHATVLRDCQAKDGIEKQLYLTALANRHEGVLAQLCSDVDDNLQHLLTSAQAKISVDTATSLEVEELAGGGAEGESVDFVDLPASTQRTRKTTNEGLNSRRGTRAPVSNDGVTPMNELTKASAALAPQGLTPDAVAGVVGNTVSSAVSVVTTVVAYMIGKNSERKKHANNESELKILRKNAEQQLQDRRVMVDKREKEVEQRLRDVKKREEDITRREKQIRTELRNMVKSALDRLEDENMYRSRHFDSLPVRRSSRVEQLPEEFIALEKGKVELEKATTALREKESRVKESVAALEEKQGEFEMSKRETELENSRRSLEIWERQVQLNKRAGAVKRREKSAQDLELAARCKSLTASKKLDYTTKELRRRENALAKDLEAYEDKATNKTEELRRREDALAKDLEAYEDKATRLRNDEDAFRQKLEARGTRPACCDCVQAHTQTISFAEKYEECRQILLGLQTWRKNIDNGRSPEHAGWVSEELYQELATPWHAHFGVCKRCFKEGLDYSTELSASLIRIGIEKEDLLGKLCDAYRHSIIT